jgi:beta-phosphoglucomutase-like phosphatase (HAD superfamily)
MRTTGQTRPARTFWWERAQPTHADVSPLRAVIFDADALVERDGELAPRSGLIDLVMSLFVAGVWVGVVSTRRRGWTETLVRQLVGDGLVETIVTIDDLPDTDSPGCDAELYRLALWELGITPHDALAITGSERGLRAAAALELPADLRDGYDGLLAAECQQLHRRWRIRQRRCRAA